MVFQLVEDAHSTTEVKQKCFKQNAIVDEMQDVTACIVVMWWRSEIWLVLSILWKQLTGYFSYSLGTKLDV